MQPSAFGRPLAAGLALLAGLAVWPSPAEALDAWRDRRGPFAGIGVGGGAGVSETDHDLRGERQGVGLFGMARAGGGITRRLTMDVSLGWMGRGFFFFVMSTTEIYMLVAAATNVFLTDEVFVRGGLGVARGTLADEHPDKTNEVSAFSLGYLAGGGIEFFLNADLAASFTVQFQQHLFSDVRYTGVHGFAGLTWY